MKLLRAHNLNLDSVRVIEGPSIINFPYILTICENVKYMYKEI